MVGLIEFIKVMKETRTLTNIEAPPTLIIHTLADEVIHPQSAHFLDERLKSPIKKFIELTRSNHLVTIGVEKEKVLSEFESFFKEVTSLS